MKERGQQVSQGPQFGVEPETQPFMHGTQVLLVELPGRPIISYSLHSCTARKSISRLLIFIQTPFL